MIQIMDAEFFRNLLSRPNAAERVQAMVEAAYQARDAATVRAECAEAGFRAARAEGIRIGREAMREAAARVAAKRHKRWRMPHPDDAKPGEVCCDVSACRDIATAIRSIPISKDSDNG